MHYTYNINPKWILYIWLFLFASMATGSLHLLNRFLLVHFVWTLSRNVSASLNPGWQMCSLDSFQWPYASTSAGLNLRSVVNIHALTHTTLSYLVPPECMVGQMYNPVARWYEVSSFTQRTAHFYETCKLWPDKPWKVETSGFQQEYDATLRRNQRFYSLVITKMSWSCLKKASKILRARFHLWFSKMLLVVGTFQRNRVDEELIKQGGVQAEGVLCCCNLSSVCPQWML